MEGQKMITVNRRAFMMGTAAAGAAWNVMGANDRIRLGIIGTGSRGWYLMRNVAGNIEWVAVCDAWDERQEEGAQNAGGKVKKYSDYRRLLDHKDIDAVIVATWDNTHAPITIHACEAGKDVYVEKPMTNQPLEGREVLKAVRDNRRIVQVGMQQRSIPHFIEAKQKFFDSGLIGDVHMVRTYWNANEGYLYKPPAGMEQKPAGLDWNACLGSLPKIPWDPKRYFNRFAYWDLSSGGQTGGLFVHLVDVVHWFLDLRAPSTAVALGGIYQYRDGRDTPDNINAILEYPHNLNVTFEATITDLIPKQAVDIVFFGTGGRLSIFRGGYTFIPAQRNKELGEISGGEPSETAHLTNWLDCIRTRKTPNADAVTGHYSSMACHIVNRAYREKAAVKWQKEWDI
jgi:predicted dehydrogenase